MTTKTSSTKRRATKVITSADANKPATKLDTLAALLSRAGGASIAEMVEATGWQSHSVRGAMAGAMKKRGHNITSDKADGIRRYCIAEVGQ